MLGKWKPQFDLKTMLIWKKTPPPPKKPTRQTTWRPDEFPPRWTMGLVQALAFQLSELVFMDLAFRSSVVKKSGSSSIKAPRRCIPMGWTVYIYIYPYMKTISSSTKHNVSINIPVPWISMGFYSFFFQPSFFWGKESELTAVGMFFFCIFLGVKFPWLKAFTTSSTDEARPKF